MYKFHDPEKLKTDYIHIRIKKSHLRILLILFLVIGLINSLSYIFNIPESLTFYQCEQYGSNSFSIEDDYNIYCNLYNTTNGTAHVTEQIHVFSFMSSPMGYAIHWTDSFNGFSGVSKK